ncbi:hypothetical protein C0J52_21511, partial [Blattella germanica]
SYDYGDVIRKSLLFYEAQRSGKLPSDQQVTWRKDSALNDKGENAGDYVKFGFPMAYTITTLAWGAIDYANGYNKANALDGVRKAIKWGTDYFIKAHVSQSTLYGQVGEGQADHNSWGRPEDMTMARPAYKIDTSRPGSDLAAETAAALAAASIVFKNVDSSYSNTLLNHAKELFSFADSYRAKYSDSISDANSFYGSYSYEDELVWGAVWLYKATGDNSYLTRAEQLYDEFQLQYWDGGFGWNQITKNSKYTDKVKGWCDWMLYSQQKTPKGLVFVSEWGSLRSASNVVLICLEAASAGISPTEYRNFAKQQIDYMLGDGGRSYVVGFGNNPPTHAHHRASSCPDAPATCDWNTFSGTQPIAHVLYGALVGGPGANDDYQDVRNDAVHNEVACDYNAGFQHSELKFYCATLVIDELLSSITAGDFVKFGFPMAFTITTLAWGAIDYANGYNKANAMAEVRKAIKWGTDYFMKAHVHSTTFYGQVGQGQADHKYWGSDLAAETAAALAAASIVFASVDNTYHNNLLTHAKQLFSFADSYRGKYSDSISDGKNFYSSSGYEDELVWGAVWLYKATGDKTYLNKAEQLYSQFGMGTWNGDFGWDQKISGVEVLLSQITKNSKYTNKVKGYCDWMVNSQKKTPKGLVFLSEWGSLRSASNVAFICLEAASAGISSSTYRNFAKKQINYMLGDAGRSYVVGFGNNPPTHEHHRSRWSFVKQISPQAYKYKTWKPQAMIMGTSFGSHCSFMKHRVIYEFLSAFTAGDFVKFGFPMAYTITTLAWDAMAEVRKAIKWGTDYFMKAHVHSTTFYGSDLAAETAAALAAASIVFASVDNTYHNHLLTHAKQLFSFADSYRGKYSDSISDAKNFYSSSGYEDELVWGAVWLYKATGDKTYLNKAEQLYSQFGMESWNGNFGWDQKISGAEVLLSQITKNSKYTNKVKGYCDWMVNSQQKTPKGLVFVGDWGSLRSASNVAFICLEAASAGISSSTYRNFAKKQINYMLGDGGRSYVVGFGNNPPTHEHHRSSSCPDKPAACDWNTFSGGQANAHVLYGALVGGPGANDDYQDVRNDAQHNEVACDYNAGFQSALAALNSL